MGTTVRHQPMSGFRTTIKVAIGKIKPTGSTVTINGATTPAEKGDTTITVDALTEAIDAGNWLLFSDPITGLEYLVKVTADADIGDTSLTVEAIATDIPDNATASFPPELYDRDGVEFNQSTDVQNVLSLNTGGTELQVLTISKAEASANGYWHWWNPGLRLCEDQFTAKSAFWVIVEYETPDPAIFAKGVVTYGKAVLDSLPKGSPADGFVSCDLTFKFSGAVTTVPPVPVA